MAVEQHIEGMWIIQSKMNKTNPIPCKVQSIQTSTTKC